MSNNKDKPATSPWIAVFSLTVACFVMVTTEFLPIGLLTNIAPSLNVSTGTAGLMVTMPGIVAAIAAPVLSLASGSLDRHADAWPVAAVGRLKPGVRPGR